MSQKTERERGGYNGYKIGISPFTPHSPIHGVGTPSSIITGGKEGSGWLWMQVSVGRFGGKKVSERPAEDVSL